MMFLHGSWYEEKFMPLNANLNTYNHQWVFPFFCNSGGKSTKNQSILLTEMVEEETRLTQHIILTPSILTRARPPLDIINLFYEFCDIFLNNLIFIFTLFLLYFIFCIVSHSYKCLCVWNKRTSFSIYLLKCQFE